MRTVVPAEAEDVGALRGSASVANRLDRCSRRRGATVVHVLVPALRQGGNVAYSTANAARWRARTWGMFHGVDGWVACWRLAVCVYMHTCFCQSSMRMIVPVCFEGYFTLVQVGDTSCFGTSAGPLLLLVRKCRTRMECRGRRTEDAVELLKCGRFRARVEGRARRAGSVDARKPQLECCRAHHGGKAGREAASFSFLVVAA